MNGQINPAVSIIIPTYNHAHFLRLALSSVCSQTFNNWEAIVVNNFSQDNTIEIVNSFNDPRIQLTNYENKGIIAAARNYGLSLAKAPIIAFLDSDDIWYPEKLRFCLEKLETGYDLVCHSEVWIGPGDKRRVAHYGPEERASYERLFLDGNILSTSAVVLQRKWLERVGGFSTKSEFVTAEDYQLWLKIAREGARIGFVNEVLGEYHIHDGNQSRVALRNMEAVLAVFQHHRSLDGHNWSQRRLRRREALIFYSGARGLQDSHQFKEAWPYFIKALKTYPWVPKFYAAMLLNLFNRSLY